jgi:hypothetical protein
VLPFPVAPDFGDPDITFAIWIAAGYTDVVNHTGIVSIGWHFASTPFVDDAVVRETASPGVI